MKYILEAMPMNSKHRPLYYTNKRGMEWLSPHVIDAFHFSSEEKANFVKESFNERIKKHGKNFRVITIASSVVQRITPKR